MKAQSLLHLKTVVVDLTKMSREWVELAETMRPLGRYTQPEIRRLVKYPTIHCWYGSTGGVGKVQVGAPFIITD